MGRYGIAMIACLVVLAGCASPRVMTAEGPSVATADATPAAIGWDESRYMVTTDFELGTAPAVRAAGASSFSEGAAPAEDFDFPPCQPQPPCPPPAPAVPAEPTEPVEAVLAPADIEVAPAPATGPRLNSCCGECNDCCKKCPCTDPCGNPCTGYVGAALTVGPGFGGLVEGGINFKRTNTALWSWDFSLMFQDFSDELADGDRRNAGKMNMARIGVRARFMPCCKWHPTLRLGLGWMQATGAPEQLDLAEIDGKGDYLGAYAGLGLEYDINTNWSTGPEIMIFGGFDVGNTDNTAFVPTVVWHLNYRF